MCVAWKLRVKKKKKKICLHVIFGSTNREKRKDKIIIKKNGYGG